MRRKRYNNTRAFVAYADPKEREEFLRDNAVAVVADRDEYIGRLKKTIAKLENSIKNYKGMLRKFQPPKA